MYDVIIVGAGPAGLAVANELLPNLKVLLLEKGKGINDRTSKTSGFGGAGLFSDGKLVYSTTVGGNLRQVVGERFLKEYLARSLNLFNVTLPTAQVDTDLTDRCFRSGLELIRTQTIHLGTDGVFNFSMGMLNKLNKVEIRTGADVSVIHRLQDRFQLVYEPNHVTVETKQLVLAPGREGAEWLNHVLTGFNIKSIGNQVDLGVRLELPNSVVEELVDFAYDFKLYYYAKPYDDKVRTFCVCPGGEVVREHYDSLITCNGHSYSLNNSPNTNFAVLVSIPFSHPIDPIKYGKSIVSLANNISDGGVIVQRLADLEVGRRTTQTRLERSIVSPTLEHPYTGDLSLVLPHRYLTDVLGMLKALDKVAPGVWMPDNLIYGVEAKFYSNVIDLSMYLETAVPHLFCIGDGSGLTRGILQAAASGLIVADTINRRESNV